MEQCIGYAIAHNVTVRQSAVTATESEIDVNTSKWARLPQLNGSAQQSWSWGRAASPIDNTYNDTHSSNSNFSLSTDVPLYTAMLDVVRRFNLMNGGGTLPPKWGLGFWQRVGSLLTDKEVETEVGDFEKRGYPLSVIGLEPGWQSCSYPCSYEWDKTRFPNPKQFVQGLDAKKVKVNVWMNPYIAPKTKLYDALEPFSASHTVWCGIVPDYSMDTVQAIVTKHLTEQLVNIGVMGVKLDENDGYDSWLWPDVATFPSRHPAEQMRQVYGSLIQQNAYRMYHRTNHRTYGLVRAGNAGTSSFPFVLYNDYYDHHVLNLPEILFL